MTDPNAAPSPRQGRLLILTATVMWSLNGLFIPALTSATPLGLHEPKVHGLHIAFYRTFFAGLVLVPALRRRDLTLRPAMGFTALCFASMNVMFVLAMEQGGVASAMFLQYTAPTWLFLASVLWLGEPVARRNQVAVVVALVGVVIIVAGGWSTDQLRAMALGLGSGITYAGILLGIRLLRESSSRWVTVVNLMTAALVLLPWILFLPSPTWQQVALLMVFGAVQLGLPYWLMARGLRSVGTQEAGTLTLVEPLLSTLWAYLVAGQVPTRWTLLGGAFILGALLYQYAPQRRSVAEGVERR